MRLPGGRTLYRRAGRRRRRRAASKHAARRRATADADADLAAAAPRTRVDVATIERLNGELDSMAEELSERYEELNLVYATSRDGTAMR